MATPASPDTTDSVGTTDDNALGGLLNSGEDTVLTTLASSISELVEDAQTAATNAGVSSVSAAASATSAANSLTAIGNSVTVAAASAAAALVSENNSATSESNAATSETNAATSETNAEDWAVKTNGIVESTDYSSKAWAIGGTGVTNTANRGPAKDWATKAEDVTVDGTGFSALHYAAKASTSATNAATSKTAAALSATQAAGSATNADTSAGNASDSEIDAAASAAAAASSASTASTQASNASASAATASTQASNASTSAATASTQATNAASSATTASTQATNASNSATAAATSATSASSAQTAAEAARDQALAAFDNFDDKYLGAKTADPTTDNDGDPLQSGMLYYNTTNDVMKVYTGSAWVAAYVSGGGFALLTGATFTGDISAPNFTGNITTTSTGVTQASGTNNTSLSTTAFAVTEANNAAVAMAIALG